MKGIKIRSVASGINYAVYHRLDSEGRPLGRITKGWAATEAKARQKARDAVEVDE